MTSTRALHANPHAVWDGNRLRGRKTGRVNQSRRPVSRPSFRPKTPRIELEVYEQQADFIECPDRFTAFIGGIGSGKTTAGAVKGLVESSQFPHGLGLVIAPTYTMLRDATVRTFMDVFGPAVQHWAKGDMVATLVNGSEVLFRSADSPDRLRGPNIHWCWIDEGALCPNGTFEIAIGRLRADGRAGDLWITSTPRGHNWLFQKRGLLRLFKAKTAQNPYLDREFVHSLEVAYTGKFAEQELGGEFVRFEGLVYSDFDRETHVKTLREIGLDSFRDFEEILIGGDEGFVNPSVFLVIGIYGGGERAHILHEFYERRVIQSAVVDAAVGIAAEFAGGRDDLTFYMDPSAAGLSYELSQRNLTVHKADHTVFEGLQFLQTMISPEHRGFPALTVDPSCVWTIQEFESYQWKESGSFRNVDGTKEIKDEPLKQNDHAMDSLRYALYSTLGKRLGGKLFV